MLRQTLRWASFLIPLAALGLARVASAQTGSVTPTSVQLEALPIDASAQIELVEESAVDLRPYMPPVGEQKINDCTAWAAAYAKSYAEAREQGWKPDSPARIFSPTFLYNQVNRGQDKGSSILDVAKLMSSKGAATLATAPYTPTDFLSPPSPRALSEANAFPIADANRLMNRTAIRRALQRRSVVVFGAHVGPLFMSGKSPIYTRELFTRDDKLRQPGQPHGKHAMLIVGYDDSKKAFLLQNSWGTKWAQNGYCYVSYDLFDEIRPTGADSSDGVFCNWALVMNDIDEPLEFDANGKPTPKKVEFWELKPGGFADIRGFNAERKRFHYTFVATLKGPRDLLAQVDSVTWRWNDENGAAQVQASKDKAGRFVVVGTADTSPVKIAATVRRTDGEAFDIQGELAGQSPKAEFRSATPIFKDRYWGRRNDGKPLFQVRATVDVPLAERSQIKEVVYTTNGKTSTWPGYGELTDYGPMSWLTEEPFPIEAAVHYVDGGVKTLTFTPQITDDIFDGRRIVSSSRKISQTQDGRSVYAVTLSFDRPSRDDFKISRVEYYVGPHFAEPTLISADTFGAYEVFLTTDRDFRVRMTVFEEFQGQKKQESIEQWISVGPDTKFTHPANIELVAADTYLGRAWNTPIRRSTVRLIGDFKSLERISSVQYTLPAHLGGTTKTITRQESGTFELTIDDSRPFSIDAVANLEDGTTLPFAVSHAPASAIHDGLGLSVEAEPQATFWIDQTQPMRFATRIKPSGTPHDLWNIRSITYRGVFDGIPYTETLELDRYVSPNDATLGCAPRTPVELEAILTDNEDFEQSIRTTITPGVSRDDVPAIGLRIREKLWNTTAEGLPSWIARIDLHGSEKELQAVKSATIALTRIDQATAFETKSLSDDITEELAFLVSRPTRVAATLEMKDGSHRQLEGLIRTESASLPPLQLRVRQRMSYPDSVQETTIHLSGQEESVRNVKSVAYSIAGDQEPVVVSSRETWAAGAFARTIAGAVEGEVSATVTMLDGSTRSLRARASPRERPMGYVVKTWPGEGELGRVQISLDGWPYLFQPFGWGNNIDLDYHQPRDWLAFPSNTLVFDALSGTQINLSRVRSWYAGNSLELPGRKIDVPSRQREIVVLCVAHPTRGNEWIAKIVGPIEQMAQVRKVRYRNTDSGTVAEISQRWGETSDGFELRFRGATPPTISAEVEMADGSKKPARSAPPAP